jgi:hypothetical protein
MQHGSLSLERWRTFAVDQQILMIANELNRAAKLAGAANRDRLRNGYERALALTDLTVQAGPRPGLLRELLRWRDLLAALYLGAELDAPAHRALLRALLRLHPTAAAQIPFVAA